jgi:hypothetical protein
MFSFSFLIYMIILLRRGSGLGVFLGFNADGFQFKGIVCFRFSDRREACTPSVSIYRPF